MKNKEKYDLRNIAYALKVNNGEYDFVIYHNSIEIHRENFFSINSVGNYFTKWLEEEYKPTILTDKEKAYLSAVIKPFREEVETIEKASFEEDEQLQISDGDTVMAFPCFEKGTMYKGMEVNREYTLKELEL